MLIKKYFLMCATFMITFDHSSSGMSEIGFLPHSILFKRRGGYKKHRYYFGTKFYKILQNSTKFYKILQNSTKFYKILQNSTKFYKILQNSTKFYKILQNCTKLYKILQKSLQISVFQSVSSLVIV